MSYAPRRISSNAVGSKPYSSGGRPGDRVEPDVGDLRALERPHVGVHLVFVDHARGVLEVGLRHVPLEEVGRLDDVVVDADEDEVVHVHDWCSPGSRGCTRAYARWPRHPTPRMLPRMPEPGAVPAPLRPEAVSDDRYRVTNTGDADQRDVVFGGQFLAQAIVAVVVASSGQGRPLDPGVFARPGRIDAPTELAVDAMHDGRTFASDTVTVWQGDRLCARFMVLLDADEPDVIRHDVPMPRVAGAGRHAADRTAAGSSTRVPTCASSTTSTCGRSTRPSGRPRRFLWAKAPRRSPTIPRCTARCSRGPPTASSSRTALRPHAGINQDDAHRGLSTGVVGHTIVFHESFRADEWLLLAHESPYAGRGRTFGQRRRVHPRRSPGRVVRADQHGPLLRRSGARPTARSTGR